MRYYLLVFIIFSYLALFLILYATIASYNRKDIFIFGRLRDHHKVKKHIHKKTKHHHKIMKSKCREKCSSKICNDYEERLNNFSNCQKCRLENKCYSVPQGNCIKCSQRDLDTPCTDGDLFGCENPKGFQLNNVPPINPAQTKCQPSWENQRNINV